MYEADTVMQIDSKYNSLTEMSATSYDSPRPHNGLRPNQVQSPPS